MAYNYEKVNRQNEKWKGFDGKYKRGLLKLYAQHAVSSMKGAYMDESYEG